MTAGPFPTALERSLADELPGAWSLLRDLVRLNTFSGNGAGVERAGELIASRLAKLGFVAQRFPSSVPGQGRHRLLRRPGSSSGKVALVSHLDTVYPPELQRPGGFEWEERGGRIHGPGVVDIHGGTALAVLLLRAFAAARPSAFAGHEWCLLLNAAEEPGSPDFPGLAREWVGGDCLACLVFEHGNPGASDWGTLTVSRRGSARLRLETRGRSAHSGSGHAFGINAVREMARLVERVESLSDPSRGLTANIGRIEGGVVANTVPERCEALVDLRADDPELFERGVQQVLSLAGEGSLASAADGRRGEIIVERLPGYPPWPPNPGTESLASIFRQAAVRLGGELGTEHRYGASDGCHLWDLAPTIDGLGPIGGDIHSAVNDPATGRGSEWMLRDSLETRARLGLMALDLLLARG